MDIKDFRNEATLVATKYLLDKYGAYYDEKELLKYNDKLFHITYDGFYGLADWVCFMHVTPPKTRDFYIKVNYNDRKGTYSIDCYIPHNSVIMSKSYYDEWINDAAGRI